jgi:hypothetical protein
MAPLEESDIAFKLGELVSGQKETHTGLQRLQSQVAAVSTQVAKNATEIDNLKRTSDSQWEKLNAHVEDTAPRAAPVTRAGFTLPKLTVKGVSVLVAGGIVGIGVAVITLVKLLDKSAPEPPRTRLTQPK